MHQNNVVMPAAPLMIPTMVSPVAALSAELAAFWQPPPLASGTAVVLDGLAEPLTKRQA